ncbi:MAG: DJ-1/PfpI family protein [Candidatus Thorarchaeota archaeon]
MPRRFVKQVIMISIVEFIVIFGSVQGSTEMTIEFQESINILLLMDHDYGGNVPYIMDIFERYGWSITTTGLNQTLISCSYLGYEEHSVDIMLTDITDITVYDAISIMPGESHEILRTNQSALDLISSAMSEGIIVSAWCRAVRVLAAADVINGRNITGNADYEAEYIAAGATFNELVPPVIDGNLVTGVRSRFYREEMCEAIAATLGLYESDGPKLLNAVVNPKPSILGTNVNLTVQVNDVSGIYRVVTKVFALNATTGERLSQPYECLIALNETSVGFYEGTITDLGLGNYTVDITVWDIFMNEDTFSDATNLLVVEQLTIPEGSGIDPIQLAVLGAVIGGVGIVIVLLILLRRR